MGNVKNFTAKGKDGKVLLTWEDPDDIIFEGEILAEWAGTKIVRKTNGFPVSENDGVLVVNSLIRDQYATVPFIDTGLENEVEYYYAAFPYSTKGAVTLSEANRIVAMPTATRIYGVRIDENNSNPLTRVEYTDDAVSLSPAPVGGGTSAWDNIYPFNETRPVLFKDGEVVVELNKNDYTRDIDGNSVDITSGNAGDVMIEFPKIWWKIYREGSCLYVKYATDQIDETWKCLAHTRAGVERDHIYIGAYLGYEQDGRLRSLSGKKPTASKTIGAFRTIAQANGNGYEQMTYFQLLMLQILFTIKYKSTDSQTALGRGFVDGNSDARATGGTDTKTFCFGETTGKQQMKFLGIEDFWGNLRYWIDGLYSDANRNILIGDDNFNDTGAGYTNYGQGATADVSGYITEVQGGTETGFITKVGGGSATTYYCDSGYLAAGRLPYFGAYWSNASNGGAFSLIVRYSASFTTVGGRLSFV